MNTKNARKMFKKFTDQLPKIGIVISVLSLLVGLWLGHSKLISFGIGFLVCNLGVLYGGHLRKQQNI